MEACWMEWQRAGWNGSVLDGMEACPMEWKRVGWVESVLDPAQSSYFQMVNGLLLEVQRP
eukprot:1161184-Pelagomonas_calceolata.AAC.4